MAAIQAIDAEHQRSNSLLLRLRLQRPDAPRRNAKNTQIQPDVERRADQKHRVTIDTRARQRAIPDLRAWHAPEGRDEHQSQVCQRAGPDHEVDAPPDCRGFNDGENALELQEDGPFGEDDCWEPENHEYVPPLSDGQSDCRDRGVEVSVHMPSQLP